MKKNTYIKYQNCKYPIDNCQFWTDCVVYFDREGGETIIPNDEWIYHEEDVVVESKTFKQFQDEIDYRDKVWEDGENKFVEEFGEPPLISSRIKSIPELYEQSLKDFNDYYYRRSEYVKTYLKAHLPHQISFPTDTLD